MLITISSGLSAMYPLASGLGQGSSIGSPPDGCPDAVEDGGENILHAHEIGHEGRRWPLENIPDGSGLYNNTLAHDSRLRGERQRLGEVVRDHQKRDAGAFVDVLEQQPDFLSETRVEGGQRFVQKNDPGLHHEGPRKRRALKLPTAQGFRTPVEKMADAEVVDELLEALPGGFRVMPVVAEASVYVDPTLLSTKEEGKASGKRRMAFQPVQCIGTTTWGPSSSARRWSSR